MVGSVVMAGLLRWSDGARLAPTHLQIRSRLSILRGCASYEPVLEMQAFAVFPCINVLLISVLDEVRPISATQTLQCVI